MSEFKNYRKKALQPLRPYVPGEDVTGVSISDADRATGSPREGDMIAQNPANPNDRWLVAQEVFAVTYELAE
jgi:hypothetical protein